MVFAVTSVSDSPSDESAPYPSWSAAETSAIRASESRVRWARELALALETLGPDERYFLQLSYFDGLGHAQIAEQAGVPLATVSRGIAAGMRHLARVLEQA